MADYTGKLPEPDGGLVTEGTLDDGDVLQDGYTAATVRRLIAEAEERATERAASLVESLIADGTDQSYFADAIRARSAT